MRLHLVVKFGSLELRLLITFNTRAKYLTLVYKVCTKQTFVLSISINLLTLYVYTFEINNIL